MTSDARAARQWAAIGSMTSAHIIMLRDVGLIDDRTLGALLRANEAVRSGEPEPARGIIEMAGRFDDRADGLTPSGIAGAGRVGRGPIEIAAAATRAIARDDLLSLADSLSALRGTLIELARGHVVTLMPATVDAIVAQPTTLGHLLGGAIAPLGRAAVQLQSAVALSDRSPLGSGALASTGMPIDRARAAELAGFAEAIPNTFDALAAIDHFLAVADTVAAVASPVRRLAGELIDWIRVDPLLIRSTDDQASLHGNLPQFRGPAGLVKLRQRAMRVETVATALRTMATGVGYGPVADELDGLANLAGDALDAATQLLGDAADLYAHGVEINRALFANRAGKAFSTASDLADFLMIEEEIDPGAARNIAALTISRAREGGIEAAGITPELIDGAALLVIGQEIKVEFEAISRYLAPRRFIERRTAEGAPSPAATRAYLDAEQAQLDRDIAWREACWAAFEARRDELARVEAEAFAAVEH